MLPPEEPIMPEEPGGCPIFIRGEKVPFINILGLFEFMLLLLSPCRELEFIWLPMLGEIG